MATDWALEIFKVVGTGITVGAGAFIGFRLNDQGRKNDILYKEKYKSFELTMNRTVNRISAFHGFQTLISQLTLSKVQNFGTTEIFNFGQEIVNSYLNSEKSVQSLIFCTQNLRSRIRKLDQDAIDYVHYCLKSIFDAENDGMSQSELLRSCTLHR